jgi:hypothetical protein
MFKKIRKILCAYFQSNCVSALVVAAYRISQSPGRLSPKTKGIFYKREFSNYHLLGLILKIKIEKHSQNYNFFQKISIEKIKKII